MLRLFLVSQREKLFLFPSCERLPFSKAQSEGAKRSCRHLPTQDLDGCHTYDHITMAIRHRAWPPASPRYWTQIPNSELPKNSEELCPSDHGFDEQINRDTEWRLNRRTSQTLLISEIFLSSPALFTHPAKSSSSSTLFINPSPN